PDTLSNIPVALFFFFYLLVFFGVFVLRKKYPEIERPYTVPMYPVVPILAIVGGIYIVYSAIKGGPTYMVVAIAITLTGLFFYKK
ncbi:MAG: APC family permease, partial [Fusobacteriaceae bacterium]